MRLPLRSPADQADAQLRGELFGCGLPGLVQRAVIGEGDQRVAGQGGEKFHLEQLELSTCCAAPTSTMSPTPASAEERRMLTCARGTRITADAMPLDVLAQDFDLIVLPGGMPGAQTLGELEPLAERVRQQAAGGREFAAICAAPAVLHAYGVLKGAASPAIRA
ncbi:hypothetical protein SSTU70S_02692 [Stutzerimonas stutzeri]